MMIEVQGQQDINNLNGEAKVILKFGAPWCAPCKIIDKTLEEISNEGDIVVALVNLDNNPELAGGYGVMSVPTTFIIKEGIRTAKFVGVETKAKLLQQFE